MSSSLAGQPASGRSSPPAMSMLGGNVQQMISSKVQSSSARSIRLWTIKKIGCLGASYGGFMTQYLQTQTDIFAAAVSHAGISDVTSYWGEGYWGYSYNAIAAADSYPWKDPELFTKQGSLFNADKINTPLLLLHGTVDTNVPVGESIQLFNALKILGKTVELVTVDEENHFISDYDKRIKWHNSIMAWFARWLQNQPEWWNEMYPERHL